jgi:hypothetical protein
MVEDEPKEEPATSHEERVEEKKPVAEIPSPEEE